MIRPSDRIDAAVEPWPDPAGGSPVAGSPGGPLYRAIYEHIAQAIRSGRYPVMTLLPTEHELCEQFGASRHTIREAIRMLTEAGMVSRRPGVGTRVETARSPTRFTQRISQFPDLLQYARSAALLVRKSGTVKASARLAEILGCEAGQTWLHVDTIKTLGGQDTPVASTQIYAPPDSPALRRDVGGKRLSLLQLIEDHFGNQIQAVNQEFSAIPIPTMMARRLMVEPGTAGLVISRRYYGRNGAMLLATITTFPYDRMKYAMSLNVA